MDIKSIVRTYRYNEMQQKADRDPEAKRPPTIKFLAIGVAVGVLAFAFAVVAMSYQPAVQSNGVGSPLGVPSESLPPLTNETASPTPTSDVDGWQGAPYGSPMDAARPR